MRRGAGRSGPYRSGRARRPVDEETRPRHPALRRRGHPRRGCVVAEPTAPDDHRRARRPYLEIVVTGEGARRRPATAPRDLRRAAVIASPQGGTRSWRRAPIPCSGPATWSIGLRGGHWACPPSPECRQIADRRLHPGESGPRRCWRPTYKGPHRGAGARAAGATASTSRCRWTFRASDRRRPSLRASWPTPPSGTRWAGLALSG